ncbi:hypothetical protein MNBD_GAMMA11-2569 [hydrothermal vent metagenome]|uniref:Uncharacterized protein n=1 Tax=hydrothermal vent metagenome TaxID=652676 RepID=A0A3B0X2P3_9ZZZZ
MGDFAGKSEVLRVGNGRTSSVNRQNQADLKSHRDNASVGIVQRQAPQITDNRLKAKKRLRMNESGGPQSGVLQPMGYENAGLNAKRRKARIGLELAFNNDFSKKHFSNDGAKISASHNLVQIKQAATLLATQWEGAAQVHANTLAGVTLVVTNEAHPQGDEHIFGKAFSEVAGVDYGRKKFTYTGLSVKDGLYDRPDDMSESDHEDWMSSYESPELKPYEDDAGSWWWGITADPAVYELQTHHTSWQVMNQTQVADIIDGAIFAPAAALGLTADKGVGGGQINIDFATGFAADYNKVLKTLNNAEDKKGVMEASGLGEDNDINGPYLYKSRRVDFNNGDSPVDEEVMKGYWLVLFKKYDGLLAGKDEWGVFVEEFVSLLRHYPSARQRYSDFLNGINAFFGVDDHQDDIFHFQALNVGHLENDADEAKRVEFRDFKAQANRVEISDAVDLALSIIPD